MPDSPDRNAPDRFHGIDVLKALAILSVVWIHAHDVLQAHANVAVQITRTFSHFVVASFLFASGFLHQSSTPLSGRVVWRRLQRVLVPYAIASAFALAFGGWMDGRGVSAGKAFYALATGSAFGFYHFVPLLAAGVVLSYFLSRSTAFTWIVCAATLLLALLTAQGIIDVGMFWYPRHPVRWWVYYLAGWQARALWPAIGALAPRRTRGLAMVLGSMGVLLAMAGSWWLSESSPRWLWGALIYLGSLCWVSGIVFAVRRGRSHPTIRFLADATYPVYLYHYFFVIPVFAWLGHVGSIRTAAVGYVAGWAGSLLVIYVVRRLFGASRARLLIG